MYADVISCSRRTDIPRCYPGWLEEKLAAGSVTFRGPRGGLRTVSLAPDAVHSLVLWSKDYGPLLKRNRLLQLVEKLNPFFHFTITGLGGSVWEPDVPGWESAVEAAERLAARFGSERINWRFDPVVHWREGTGTASNLACFGTVAAAMSEIGIKTCTFSFAQWYSKSRRRAGREGLEYVDPPGGEKLGAAAGLIREGQRLGIRLASCSNPEFEAIPGVNKARCIDGGLLAELRVDGVAASLAKDASQRDLCGCTRSIDIGSYAQRCAGRACAYCYAN